jgi:dephospho-CoA kinase
MIVGLTGSIAMGKSTAAKMARGLGVAVFDSDATVRALTAPHGQALPAIATAFPSVVENGTLDRKALAQIVFNTPQKLHRLESILHPMVKQARQKFLQTATRRRRKLVVFDIPLLFETKAERECDLVLVVCAPVFLQLQRVGARPGMTAALFNSILQRQMPALQKAQRADIVISSGLGRAVTFRQLKKALVLNRRT